LRRLSKHPFIPLREDSSLHFPPSPLNPNYYSPSREHLEARLDSRSPKQLTSKAPVKRQPVPVDEEGGVDKHAQIAMALQSSGARTPLTSSKRAYF